ncbi:unnamed protein product [Periconia digitata]|uniref:Uncharacterized protein n=1 Tax=Periconia digitata TaxID=1303443 RepID=A0A9W4UHM3_9PLEO|nr:unnamed protein product [Periconia digitata]
MTMLRERACNVVDTRVPLCMCLCAIDVFRGRIRHSEAPMLSNLVKIAVASLLSVTIEVAYWPKRTGEVLFLLDIYNRGFRCVSLSHQVGKVRSGGRIDPVGPMATVARG